MKATLAFVACLLTAGFLTAAEVVGNNTAVVIRKDVVKSDTGYQFLCVPVNGLDIAGGENAEIAIETLLPVATFKYANGTKILSAANEEIATVTNGAWAPAGTTLAGGTIFWLKVAPASQGMSLRSGRATTMSETGDEPIVFCGQERTRMVAVPTQGMTALKNDSSEAITPMQAVSGPAEGDRILVIQNGSSDYAQYNYTEGKWWGPGWRNDCTNQAVIAPGEAFYYYKK